MKLTADWICGFVEGEGTFCISVLPKMRETNSKISQVRLYFKVCQHVKNIQVLYELKKVFGVGHVKPRKKDGTVWEFSISRFEHLITRVIPFFEKNPLHTSQKFDFLRFRKTAILMERKEHLTEEGCKKILLIARRMNTIELIAEEVDEDKVRTFSREEEEIHSVSNVQTPLR